MALAQRQEAAGAARDAKKPDQGASVTKQTDKLTSVHCRRAR